MDILRSSGSDAEALQPQEAPTPAGAEKNTPLVPGTGNSGIALTAVIVAWVPAMMTASYAWKNGEYYHYGWFVPAAAVFLLIRRWMEEKSVITEFKAWQLLVWVAGVGTSVFVFRVLHHADPWWRLPMVALGVVAVAASHGMLGFTRGWRTSWRFWMISGLALSAVPWPVSIESHLVNLMTQGVIASVAEAFQLLGKPVVLMGDHLQLHETTVEVTDGCSGIRSFQSFLMATFFFAELQRLRFTGFLALLLTATATAFVVNATRTWMLAQIRFSQGVEAFEKAHDPLGIAAFTVSGIVFYCISGRLSAAPKRRLVKTRQQTKPQ